MAKSRQAPSKTSATVSGVSTLTLAPVVMTAALTAQPFIRALHLGYHQTGVRTVPLLRPAMAFAASSSVNWRSSWSPYQANQIVAACLAAIHYALRERHWLSPEPAVDGRYDRVPLELGQRAMKRPRVRDPEAWLADGDGDASTGWTTDMEACPVAQPIER